jgi:hypothetical protein
MRSSRILLLILLASAVAVSACDYQPSGGIHSSSASSRRAASSAPADKFSIAPKQEPVAGENVLVFRYPSVREARLDAAKLSKDGTMIGDKDIPWKGTPRFFRKESVIVLYVGSTQAVIDALKSGYGEPFAGPVGAVSSAASSAAASSVR